MDPPHVECPLHVRVELPHSNVNKSNIVYFTIVDFVLREGSNGKPTYMVLGSVLVTWRGAFKRVLVWMTLDNIVNNIWGKRKDRNNFPVYSSKGAIVLNSLEMLKNTSVSAPSAHSWLPLKTKGSKSKTKFVANSDGQLMFPYTYKAKEASNDHFTIPTALAHEHKYDDGPAGYIRWEKTINVVVLDFLGSFTGGVSYLDCYDTQARPMTLEYMMARDFAIEQFPILFSAEQPKLSSRAG